MTTPNPAPAPAAAGIDLAGLAADNLSPVLGRYFERTWSHGEGHRLYDTDGRAYLDFANGIAVSVLGHRNPRISAAIHAQVDRLVAPMAAMGYAEPTVRLARDLAATLPEPIDSVFFLNSGSEAIEAALKMARRVTGRPGIVAFRGGFHGRTFGAASITSSNPNYRRGYEPLLPGVYLSLYPSVYREFAGDEERAVEVAFRHLRELFHSTIDPDEVAAIVIEPVQGEGGYVPAPAAFLQILRRVCDRHGILLVADEVQSGFGRTGKMWAFEHAGIVPDVVCMAKAIANGLPLSAMASSRALQERWGRSAHGSTYGGNPVACAAGLAVLEEIRGRDLVANAAARGAELTAGLNDIAAGDPRIGDIRGPGLMIGLEFVKDRETREPDGPLCEAVIQRCADEGLLVLSCGVVHNVIRWIPPLDVSSEEIAEALGIVRKVLASTPPGGSAASEAALRRERDPGAPHA
jgi:4-aminobutyrate aminotransferase